MFWKESADRKNNVMFARKDKRRENPKTGSDEMFLLQITCFLSSASDCSKVQFQQSMYMRKERKEERERIKRMAKEEKEKTSDCGIDDDFAGSDGGRN